MIQIFVEGPTDIEFLELYLDFLGLLDSEISIQFCNGNNLLNVITHIQKAQDNESTILVIFDSDLDHQETLGRLIAESSRKIPRENFFLFPNNQDAGELETLLFKIAKYPEICDCFERYKTCVASINPSYCKNIHKKSARFAYFEALGLSLSAKDDKATNARRKAYTSIFDFHSAELNPLKNFLTAHIPKTKISNI